MSYTSLFWRKTKTINITTSFTYTAHFITPRVPTDGGCDTAEKRGGSSCKIHLAAICFFFPLLRDKINCVITSFRLGRREKNGSGCKQLPPPPPPLCGDHLLIHPEKLRLRGDIQGVIWRRGTRRGEIDGIKRPGCSGHIHMVIPPHCPYGNRGFL